MQQQDSLTRYSHRGEEAQHLLRTSTSRIYSCYIHTTGSWYDSRTMAVQQRTAVNNLNSMYTLWMWVLPRQRGRCCPWHLAYLPRLTRSLSMSSLVSTFLFYFVCAHLYTAAIVLFVTRTCTVIDWRRIKREAPEGAESED